MSGLDSSADLAHGFIPGTEGYDGEEGEEEARQRPDVPGGKDDAEVVIVGVEEHVHGAHVAAVTHVHVGRRRAVVMMGHCRIRKVSDDLRYPEKQTKTSTSRL